MMRIANFLDGYPRTLGLVFFAALAVPVILGLNWLWDQWPVAGNVIGIAFIVWFVISTIKRDRKMRQWPTVKGADDVAISPELLERIDKMAAERKMARGQAMYQLIEDGLRRRGR